MRVKEREGKEREKGGRVREGRGKRKRYMMKVVKDCGPYLWAQGEDHG